MNFDVTKWQSEWEGRGGYTPHDLIGEWMGKRGSDFQDYAGIPSRGAIVSHDNRPVALMGIRVCEGGLGLIDTFCSDPDVDPEIRNSAADVLTLAILQMASDLGLIGLLGISKDTNTITRSLKHGFDVSPQVLFSKRMKGIA